MWFRKLVFWCVFWLMFLPFCLAFLAYGLVCWTRFARPVGNGIGYLFAFFDPLTKWAGMEDAR